MIRVPQAALDWFDLPRSIACIVIIGGGYGIVVWRTVHLGGSPVGVLFAAPFVAFALAPALLALLPRYADWVAERVWTPWQGIYRAFDDHQIRVVEARDTLWFSSDDVHAALSMKRREAVLRAMSTTERRVDPDAGEMLSSDGLMRLLRSSTDRTALRLLTWANNDVRRVWQKKRDMQGIGDPSPSPSPNPPPSASASSAPPRTTE